MSIEGTTTNNNGKRKHGKVDNEIDPKQVSQLNYYYDIINF